MEHWLAFATFAFVTAVTPGPNNLLLLSSGLNFGIARSAPLLFGIATGFAAMLAVVAAGLGEAFLVWPAATTVVKAAGSAYFVYLAVRLLRDARRIAPGGGGGVGFLEGAALQFLNPKAWLMSVTAVSLFAPPDAGPLAIAQLVGLFILIGTPCNALWLLAGDHIRRIAASERAIRIVNAGLAAALLASIAWVWIA